METPPPTEYQQQYQQPYEQPPRKKNTWIWILLSVLLICGCGGVILLPAILLPVFSQAKIAAVRTKCITNLKQVTLAELMYSSDFDERLPLTANWADAIYPYSNNPTIVDCPAFLKDGGHYGYAMNAAHNHLLMEKVAAPQREIAFYETAELAKNVSGDPKDEAPPDRHGRGRTEAYLDGSVKWVKTP